MTGTGRGNPNCGTPAAVGWTTIRWITGESFLEIPAEFDCPSGCHLGAQELIDVFAEDRG